MATERAYRQRLEELKIQPDHNKVITCKLCGGLMHWLQINEYVGFWLHHGKDLEECAKKNPLIKGKPVVAQNMRYYRVLAEQWKKLAEENVVRQNARSRKKMHKL